MKAMILAAGFGTRLSPWTEKRPKPLFPILDRPLIDILIHTLQNAGCKAIIINTHHLAHMIDQFVKAQAYGIPVITRNEPTILGTGGGIKDVEDFWDDEPFIVVNGDIFTNINLGEVYAYHLSHQQAATLVLHDRPEFNHVWVDPNDHVRGFGHTEPCPPWPTEDPKIPVQGARATAERGHAAISMEDNSIPELSSSHGSRQDAGTDFRKLAFTGIQILDPQVLRFIPKGTFSSIIHAYCKMIRTGLTLKGFVAQKHYWHDIGTVAGHREATRDALARKVFGTLAPGIACDSVVWFALKGDGSDRTWYRVTIKGREGVSSLIVVDHGSPAKSGVCEADSFATIGQHLHDRGIPVPRIFAYDRPSGFIVLEDLGDLNVQRLVQNAVDSEAVVGHYKNIIDLLITLNIEGAKGFEPGYAYQTPSYDRKLILEKESRYFVDAFLNGYLGLEINFEVLEDEFGLLAQRALEHPYTGLLHRDFQSRNILVRDGNYYIIDFQGARLGPLPYDLASLLIDPYAALPQTLQKRLLQYALKRLSARMAVDKREFLQAYQYCAINRNLQIIGAFAFLSRVKGKKAFEAYVFPALRSLKQNLHTIERSLCKRLRRIVEGL